MSARIALLAALAVLLAGCGGKVVAPVAQTVIGTLPNTTPPEPPVAAQYKNGDPVAGKQVFLSKGCTACHTLADAGATGTIGPNLDVSKPTLARAVDRVLNGGNADGASMPAFKGTLTTKQIADVTAYVVKASRQG